MTVSLVARLRPRHASLVERPNTDRIRWCVGPEVSGIEQRPGITYRGDRRGPADGGSVSLGWEDLNAVIRGARPDDSKLRRAATQRSDPSIGSPARQDSGRSAERVRRGKNRKRWARCDGRTIVVKVS
jgi:hypothetical protein